MIRDVVPMAEAVVALEEAVGEEAVEVAEVVEVVEGMVVAVVVVVGEEAAELPR